ncbi:hypothetical protein BYZ73_14345 [Rhodovulum viride]|uniref:Uncharacterized protein n=1 Tax=Rhodovulum viride TaxID=1231134 RepID=A0ABX9DEM5_9RHOB|nr:hypothetical protein [Rhodovulum viride]RAP40583.1 hypothetical protein BYZ73_14345 [Rhodovulum viride]
MTENRPTIPMPSLDWQIPFGRAQKDVLWASFAVLTAMVAFGAGFWALAAVFSLALAVFAQIRVPQEPAMPEGSRLAPLSHALRYGLANLVTMIVVYGAATVLGSGLRMALTKVLAAV